MRYNPEMVERLVVAIFARAGSRDEEARTVARHLVEANLVGHDSHGVLRVPSYIEWVRKDMVRPNQSARIVFETDTVAVIDGQFGFGQVIGEQAMAVGVGKARRSGLAAVALRHSGHLGRIGDWALAAADAGLVSLHWVNTSGAGILVAPFGGTDRRLSANPIAAGAPVAGGAPIVADLSTCVIAEGKIKVALNKGVELPEEAIIDGRGRPTRDPKTFYADPGAILPIAGHKGYALSVFCEILAGALTGGGTSHPSNPTAGRLLNGMFSILLDPTVFTPAQEFAREIRRLAEWLKASPPVAPGGEILMPGEPEERTRAERLARGLPLDDTTWAQLLDTAATVGLGRAEIDGLLA
jgi:hydroxycarboxylate dehydrogenase B